MSYAGDITPDEAWKKLKSGSAVLVDVRTEEEWAHIGIPDTRQTDNDPLFIPWVFAGGIPNPDFIMELELQGPEDRGTELLFLCRSGQRSAAAAAAATNLGFTAYNVTEGFEGVPGPDGQRNVNGWKNRGLPTNVGQE
ncbi:rhodanese-like domain-containing protein [Sinomonas sp. JGH33]|uniref:Rhodanese-like domain-containing protein n=1 Tax=Sinomonas terricola TaxID=3110330 RepID=A0ABU5T2T6_9MICC|nr:rhodanese-like domain-containing protein [Sinomonas sp. JGH33]MEA5453978.1 rhodanese-like domain-containing protein [Sinomonas sp. JGH33]